MARILCIDDYVDYAEMVARRIAQESGHEVKAVIVPLDVSVIASFAPDLIVLNLVRKMETLMAGRMTNFYTDVEGGKAFRELAELRLHVPIVITGIAVLENELPKDLGLDYLAFVEMPRKLGQLATIIDQALAAYRAKSERQLS